MIRWIPALAVLGIVLAILGAVLFPAALGGGGLLALGGAIVAQAACVLLTRIGPLSPRRADPVVIRIGAVTGAVTGLLYGGEIVSEYVSSAVTDASVALGWAIVGTLVVSSMVAAAVATVRLRSIRAGLTAAAYAAIAEYLVWYPFVLGAYYAMRHSASLERVWRAEGTYLDFARSGMSDIRAFVMQDFWGAGFFHLVAGLIIAGLFGTFATLATRVAQRLLTSPAAP
ncbi:hypothetical protein Cs7R123_07340 [Catellatospora sp. TT07R-123]|nr:hypothetical protein Cs7R123_07340 [Catellatospora sp. TT07R-123]